jgi:hypothetical protein
MLEEHGVDGAPDHLPPSVSVDSRGVVRFDEAYQEDEAWKDIVSAVFDEIGAAIFDRLPPDTHLNLATGAVTIDPEAEPWW